MKLARVRGNVVSSVKSAGLSGHKLLLVEDLHPGRIDVTESDPAESDPARQRVPYIAIDLAGAGVDEIVVVATGSAARIDRGGTGVPTDAAVVGIVDSVSFDGRTTYYKE